MQSTIEIKSSVNREKWSKFVGENPYGNLFQSPKMFEVFLRTKNMEPVCLFAVDENDNILASVLAFLSKEKGGILKSVATRAVIHGGPLSYTEDRTNNLCKLMSRYDEIVSQKAMFTEIRMLHEIPEFSILAEVGYTYDDHLNFLLDLTKSEEDIWGKIHNSKRRGIKRAQSIGITVKEVADKRDIKIVYNLLEETYRRARIPLANISLFESTFDVLCPLGQFKAFLIMYEGEAIASRVLLTYGNTVYDWYNGSLEKSFPLHANDLSEWHAIKWSKDNGYKIFDFCGAGKPNEEYGPREFKRRFGGELVNLGRYNKVYHPIRLNIAKIGYGVYRRIFI
ncbi:MAG: peptidoglycan bridge formation glycyltransferase FemA/FemB family protein [Candidatus Altiarchaeota archaeon]|nr:peptidoglycan bridge formation glycyltransferase FemA/FemB family protein [Candidatus Altiarchaeota archaeon]